MKRKTNDKFKIPKISKTSKTSKTHKTSENHYKSMFEHAPCPYQSLDKDGKLVEVNKEWLKTLGYKKKEVIGKNFNSFT